MIIMMLLIVTHSPWC